MADRLYTSQQADELINGLRMESKLDKATLNRMAFTISLVNVGKEVPCRFIGQNQLWMVQ